MADSKKLIRLIENLNKCLAQVGYSPMTVTNLENNTAFELLETLAVLDIRFFNEYT